MVSGDVASRILDAKIAPVPFRQCIIRSIWIVWYLECYHDIKISATGPWKVHERT